METEQHVKSSNSFLEPARIVQGFAVRQGDHIADFGAGHGYFTIPLARAVGPNGKVYAVDVQDAALDAIRSKAAFEHLLTIEYVRADLDRPGGSGLKDRFIDFVLVANVLFQTENKDMLLREAWRILRPGGRLAMIEWNAMPMLRDFAGTGTDGTSPTGAAHSTADNIGSGNADIARPLDASPRGDAGIGGVVSTVGNFGTGTARAFGPPPEARIKKDTARAAGLQAGFEYDREFAVGGHHYGLLFVKK